MTATNTIPFGWVNGKPVKNRDEFIYESRHHGPITNDDELIEFAKKATSNWLNAGWHRTFATYYLSDYALSEPKQSLTITEFTRLKELQKTEQERIKAIEDARNWQLKETTHYADNSIEELWEDRDGITKTIMTVAPHGDPC